MDPLSKARGSRRPHNAKKKNARDNASKKQQSLQLEAAEKEVLQCLFGFASESITAYKTATPKQNKLAHGSPTPLNGRVACDGEAGEQLTTTSTGNPRKRSHKTAFPKDANATNLAVEPCTKTNKSTSTEQTSSTRLSVAMECASAAPIPTTSGMRHPIYGTATVAGSILEDYSPDQVKQHRVKRSRRLGSPSTRRDATDQWSQEWQRELFEPPTLPWMMSPPAVQRRNSTMIGVSTLGDTSPAEMLGAKPVTMEYTAVEPYQFWSPQRDLTQPSHFGTPNTIYSVLTEAFLPMDTVSAVGAEEFAVAPQNESTVASVVEQPMHSHCVPDATCDTTGALDTYNPPPSLHSIMNADVNAEKAMLRHPTAAEMPSIGASTHTYTSEKRPAHVAISRPSARGRRVGPTRLAQPRDSTPVSSWSAVSWYRQQMIYQPSSFGELFGGSEEGV